MNGNPNNQSEQNIPHYRVCPAKSGADWFVNATKLMQGQYVRWLFLTITYVGMAILASILPGVIILFSAMNPVFWAGIFLAGAAASNRLDWTPVVLFEPFKRHVVNLLILGSVILFANFLIATWLISSLGEFIDFSELNKIMLQVAETSNKQPLIELLSDPQLVQQITLNLLIAMALSLPVAMAGWFAPVLILDKNMRPLPALLLSFKACTANFIPFLIYGLIGLVLIILMLTFKVIILFVSPLFLASYYTSYRDIWPEEQIAKPESDNDTETSIIL